MKRTFKIAAVIPAFILMFIADVSPELPAPYVQLVPDAHAIFGVRPALLRGGGRGRRGVGLGRGRIVDCCSQPAGRRGSTASRRRAEAGGDGRAAGSRSSAACTGCTAATRSDRRTAADRDGGVGIAGWVYLDAGWRRRVLLLRRQLLPRDVPGQPARLRDGSAEVSCPVGLLAGAGVDTSVARPATVYVTLRPQRNP